MCVFNIHADAGAAMTERSLWFVPTLELRATPFDSDHRRHHPLNHVYRFWPRFVLPYNQHAVYLKSLCRSGSDYWPGIYYYFKRIHLLVWSKLAPRSDYEIGWPKVLQRAVVARQYHLNYNYSGQTYRHVDDFLLETRKINVPFLLHFLFS